MKVLKFGGSSLADATCFTRSAGIIEDRGREGTITVVLSAMGGITDQLVASIEQAVKGEAVGASLAAIGARHQRLIVSLGRDHRVVTQPLIDKLDHQLKLLGRWLEGVALLGQCPDNVKAQVISRGEYLSVPIMVALLNARGVITAQALDPVTHVISENRYLEAAADIDATRARLKDFDFMPADATLVPGFVAGNGQGELTTLGRNGSDYSAAVLAAGLEAECCEIWTDVDGVYNADPGVVPEAFPIRRLSYREAMELSYFGAKVLHPKTIAPIARFHIPCFIKNSLKPEAEGTRIGPRGQGGRSTVKAMSHLDGLTMVNVSGPGMKGMVGMAGRVFTVMSRTGISVVMITQSSSEYSISFCIPDAQAELAHAALREEFELELQNELLEPIDLQSRLSIVSMVGDRMRTQIDVAATFFAAIASRGIHVIAMAQGSSERSISAVVPQNDAREALAACHRRFFGKSKTIDLYLVGTEGDENGFIRQLEEAREALARKNLDLRICGIAGEGNMVCNTDGIDLSRWHEVLKTSGQPFSLQELVRFAEQRDTACSIIADAGARWAPLESRAENHRLENPVAGAPVSFYAPASIGNFGLGFDVLGAGLTPVDGSLLGDVVEITPAEGKQPFQLTIEGRFIHMLPSQPEQNIVFNCYHAYAAGLKAQGHAVLPLAMRLEKRLPVGSGLGSSACSVVAALAALNAFHGNVMARNDLIHLMGRLEGRISGGIHYDNVLPCYLGGLQLMTELPNAMSKRLPFFEGWYVVIAYPGISVSTAEARAILPDAYSRKKTVAHGRQLAAFVQALYLRDGETAAAMMNDLIAEPYRKALIPGFDTVREHALKVGALACGISGSGPTVFAMTDDLSLAENLVQWLAAHFLQNENGFCRICRVDERGARALEDRHASV